MTETTPIPDIRIGYKGGAEGGGDCSDRIEDQYLIETLGLSI